MHQFLGYARLWKITTPKLWNNIHFWIILCLIISISSIYYLNGFHDYVDWFWWFRVTEYRYNINGILLYIPFIYAVLIFGWAGILIAWTVSILIILPLVVFSVPNTVSFFNNLMFLVIPTLAVFLIVFISKWVNRERKTYEDREQERRAYMMQVFKVQEEERKHIARELHDDTIQILLAIANRMHALIKNENPSLPLQAKQQMELFSNSIFRVSEDLRKLSLELRPSILDDIGLIEAIRSLIDKVNEDSINAELVTVGSVRLLANDTELIVFRFIQEALNNVRHHAEATEVKVTLNFGPEMVKIAVRDNGKGFVLPEPLSKLTAKGKLGLIGMQERAHLLGGSFYIYSQPGNGALVALEFRA